jgi:hypothetical protein
VLVLLNFWKAGKPTIDPDPALDEVLGAGELEDALTGDRVAFKPGKPIAMPAYSVRVLVPEGAEA